MKDVSVKVYEEAVDFVAPALRVTGVPHKKQTQFPIIKNKDTKHKHAPRPLVIDNDTFPSQRQSNKIGKSTFYNGLN